MSRFGPHARPKPRKVKNPLTKALSAEFTAAVRRLEASGRLKRSPMRDRLARRPVED